MQMTGTSPEAHCSVLLRHFAQVVPILTFIRERFGIEAAASSSKQSCGLSEEQWKRLSGTLVGIDTSVPSPSASFSVNKTSLRSQTAAYTPIHEAVQEAQLQILSNASSRATSATQGKQEASSNVLIKGYRRPDDRLESFRVTSTGRPGLINLYPNSMVTSLVLEKEWHYLFDRIGAERFIWLLVNLSIFVPLLLHGADGSCFVQLTGAALSEQSANRTSSTPVESTSDRVGANLKRKYDTAASEGDSIQAARVPGNSGCATQPLGAAALGKRARRFERVESRIRVRSAASGPDPDRVDKAALILDRKPSEIVIVRSRMFYARCSRNKSGRVEVGLPSVHVIPRSSCRKELDKVLPSSTVSSTPTNRSKTPSRNFAVDSKQNIKSQEAIFHDRRTRHLAKYVFPRQFGLHNVFTGARDFDTTTQPFRDYTVRETEIKALGAKRTPKALRSALPVLAKMLARHDKLEYRALLNRCCPSRVPKGRLTAQERQQIVEDLAEVEALQPSLFPDAPTRGAQKDNSSDKLASTKQSNILQSQGRSGQDSAKVDFEIAPPPARKPRYTNYAVPKTGQVVHFITLAIKSLLPRDVFGSLHNQKLILSTIGDFVRLRRYESFNLHRIAQSFRFTDVDWALPQQAVRRNCRLTRQEAEGRKRLVFELLYWIFDGLVIPLLRTTFYITETAAYRNKVLYFRQDDWHVLSKPVLSQLKESIFEPLTRAEALSFMASRKLGYSHVRLLPKETGVRPIVNLRRRSTKQVQTDQPASQSDPSKSKSKVKSNLSAASQRKESMILGQSINFILQSVFYILTYEKSQMLTSSDREECTGWDHHGDEGGANQGMLSSSVFGPNEIYTQLKTFKQRLTQGQSQRARKKLYFIKVDIRCAFDSIDQGKLLEIIERILRKDHEQETEGYRIHRFAKIMCSTIREAKSTSAIAVPRTKGTKREFVRLARPDTEHIDFFDLASSLAVALHDVVFVDGVSYRYESTSLILKLLRQHITENLIKIGKEFYRQRVGIPQGSSLSTLLCSFFYADMERQDPFLSSLRSDNRDGPKSLLMRYTDDFLLITTSKRQAKRFYQIMRQGHPEYGCFISPEKTLINFDLLDASSSNGPLVPRIYSEDFPWCGLTISTVNLGVSTDLGRYAGIDIRDTLTVEYCRRSGQVLVEKMIQSVKSRCHILFTDTALNGDRRAYSNIYKAFVVAAVKFSAYLGELRRFKMEFTTEFLYNAIQRLVRFTGLFIGSRAASAKAKLESVGSIRKLGTRRRGSARNRGVRWRVSCAIQPQNVHWLGLSAFLTVISLQGWKRRGDGKQRSPYYRCMDDGTRQSLIRMIEAALKNGSHPSASRRMVCVAAKASKDALKSLQI
ncbi:uncharacterized protein MEPE_02874 [Melanopsichium pennsylvanicum]|uniref:Telomerase reverse transcriptase n=2 Tax=Melanopsichium pennsylvanicum TaxID=63383 RepID=A0AAJ5C4X7_9BASI|nr:telomerase reverse [Melanopsichium pennsylvanicum 4]SNX84166.1 uncharacterized protein MEPE_02874 [Melanopsichium pennsylvanicum]